MTLLRNKCNLEANTNFRGFGRNSSKLFIRRDVKAKAVTLKDFGTITSSDLALQDSNSEFKQMYNKLPEFTGNLEKVPDSELDKGKYFQAVNKNAEAENNYIKAHATKVLDLDQGQVDILCSLGTFGISKSDPDSYVQLQKKTANIWASVSSIFLKVISSKMQVKVALRDQYKGLTELDEKDVEAIELDIRRIAYLQSEFSKQTSKREYIEKTPKAEKLQDVNALRNEVNKANILARIANLTVQDVPVSKIFTEFVEFQKNVNSKKLKKNLDDKVLSFKNNLIKEAKADIKAGKTFDLNSRLKK